MYFPFVCTAKKFLIMVAATAINPNLSVVRSPAPDADIARAIELWEQANELLVDAGRIFADIKEESSH